jgi:hypothetical protein
MTPQFLQISEKYRTPRRTIRKKSHLFVESIHFFPLFCHPATVTLHFQNRFLSNSIHHPGLAGLNEKEIIAYLKQNNIVFPVGLDKAELGSHGATYKAYSAKSTHAKYLVDKKGTLRCSTLNKDLEKWILRLLAE